MLFRRMIILGGLVALLAGAFLAGFAVSDYKLKGNALLRRLRDRAVVAISGEQAAVKPGIETVFLSLQRRELIIHRARGGFGGGMTSIGADVLLLTHEGEVLRVSDSEARKLSIAVPDYGLEAYQAAAATRFAELNHDFDKFRYNDILYLPTRNQLLISYTEWLDADDCYGNAVAAAEINPGLSVDELVIEASDWDVVYRSAPCLELKSEHRALEGHTAGGRMAHAGGSRLLMSNGDYHWDGFYAPEALSQRPDSDYGKIVAIDLDAGTSHWLSSGHRNPQGLVVADDGRVWSVEHSMMGGDELNQVVEGRDYGWPSVSYGVHYDRNPLGSRDEYGRHPRFEKPAHAWLPSPGISNITQIHDFDPAWDGDLLAASLRAGKLFRIRVDGDSGIVRYVEEIPIRKRIRYVLNHTNGQIVLWTDDGRLIWLSKDDDADLEVRLEATVSVLDISEERKDRLRESVLSCRQCHSLRPDSHLAGPGLGGILGRPVAGTPFGAYSSGLRARGGRWTEESLLAFLLDPTEFAPGTGMPDPNLDDQAAADLAAFLARFGAN